MYRIALVFVAVTPIFGQALVEHAAAAAGSTAGAVAGKKVSDGIDKVFRKVDGSLEKAASTGKDSPLIKVGPAQPVPKASIAAVGNSTGSSSIIVTGARGKRVERVPAGLPDLREPAAAAPEVPPAPQVTPEQLASVTQGVKRDELMARLGSPSSKITMYEDGKVIEIFRYSTREATVGSVRLTDGEVSTVTLNQR